MTETVLFLYILASIILWRLGGSVWKSFRRHILPLVTLGVLLYLGVVWWIALPTAVLQVAVNTLGYGDSSPLWEKILVSAALGLPALVITLAAWWGPIYTLVMFGGHYALSRKFNFWSWFQVEMVAGLSQGTVIAFAFLMP